MARKATNDTRKVLGSLVKAKAIHVTSAIECHRRYGALAETRILPSTVVDVLFHRNPTTNRTTTSITVDFNVGENSIKRRTLNIRSVVAIVEPETVEATQQTTVKQDELINDDAADFEIIEAINDAVVDLPERGSKYCITTSQSSTFTRAF